MTTPIPHDQLEIGQEIWVVSKNLEWLVESGTITELPNSKSLILNIKIRNG